jgi:hypothetical protein
MEELKHTRHSSQISNITMDALYKRIANHKTTESSRVVEGDAGKEVLQRSNILTEAYDMKMANHKRTESSRGVDGDAGKQVFQRLRMPLSNDVESSSNIQFSRMKELNEGNTLGVINRCFTI